MATRTKTLDTAAYSSRAQKVVLTESNPDNGVDITPSDSTDLANYGTVFVGTGGNLKVDLVGSGTVTYVNLADGTHHPMRVKRVYATGTTATDLILEF